MAEPPKEVWFSVAKVRRGRVGLATLGTCFIGYGKGQGIVGRDGRHGDDGWDDELG